MEKEEEEEEGKEVEVEVSGSGNADDADVAPLEKSNPFDLVDVSSDDLCRFESAMRSSSYSLSS